ncbi:MAG: SIS domain-containing protein [Desulfurococcaceae archaeon]
MYSRHDTRFHRLALRGGSILEKLLYGNLVLGLSSAELAVMKGLNPRGLMTIINWHVIFMEIFIV